MESRNKDAVRGRIDRRAFLRLTMLTGGAAILAACGGGAAPAVPAPTAAPAAAPTAAPAAAPTAAPAVAAPTAAPAATAPVAPATIAPSAGQVTISWFNPYTTKTTQEALPLVMAEFEKQNPDLKVDYQNPGGSGGGGSY